MKLINKKRFKAQFNKYFSEGPLKFIFLFSILVTVIASLWLIHDSSKSYESVDVSGFLVLLCLVMPSFCDTERLKRDIAYFISLNYSRREYFKNKIIIINSIIYVPILISSIIMFIMIDCSVFIYLGFNMGKNFIAFLKVSLINIIIYNLFYTFIFMVEILFIKFIPNKAGSLIYKVLRGVQLFVIVFGLRSIYIQMPVHNSILVCSILFIFIAYYIYYKFVMSLDV